MIWFSSRIPYIAEILLAERYAIINQSNNYSTTDYGVIEYDNNTLLSFKHIVNSLSQIQNKEHLRTYGSKYKEFFVLGFRECSIKKNPNFVHVCRKLLPTIILLMSPHDL